MKLVARDTTLPDDPGQWSRGEPLWKRAPKRDAAGVPYTDFMMLAPGLKLRPEHEIASIVRRVQRVLESFACWVVFADFNLKINVLWVSLRHRPGVISEIVAALRAQAPEFKLVAHTPEHWNNR